MADSSGRRLRKERRIAADRLRRAKLLGDVDPCKPGAAPPDGAVPADHAELAHNNTYGALPRFYVDRVVVCRRCGVEEVWLAERQKWWYEVAKGDINTRAVLCRRCRAQDKARKGAEASRAHLEGLERKRAGTEHD